MEGNKLDDIIENPWKKTFISIIRKKGLDKLVVKNETVFSKHYDSFLKKHWNIITPYTLLDPFRMGVLLDLVSETFVEPGDLVECGAYKGGTGILLALMFRENGIKKKIHLFDSFEGLPEPDNDQDKGYTKGEFNSNFKELQNLIRKLELENFICLHKGWFKDTVGIFIKNNPKISFLHIDCDLYQSTIDSYGPLKEHLNENAIVVFDDFNDGAKGEKRAVKELINNKKLMNYGPAPQVYYYNSQKRSPSKWSVEDGKIIYDFRDILLNISYLNWLDRVARINLKKDIETLINSRNN